MTTFLALTTAVDVEVDDDTPLDDVARAIIRPYPRTTGPKLSYRLRAKELLRDGLPLEAVAPSDIVPTFELDLYQQVVARAAPGWILHAAALDVGGRALVVCGQSGAGKTTMTLALCARGFRMLTEEMVWIDRDAVVRGLPRPIHVVAGSPQAERIPATWERIPYPIRDREGRVRDHTLVLPPHDQVQLGPLPLGAIVRIGHGPEWPAAFQRSPDAVALQRLWARSFRQDDDALAAATAVLRSHGSYQLWSTSEGEALSLLEPLLK